MASTALGAHMKNIQQDSQPTSLFPDNSPTEYFDAADFTNPEDARTEYFDAPVASSIQKNATTHHVEPTGVPVELTSAVHFELPDVIEDAKPAEEQAMVEHFELAQGPRRSLPDAELDNHGRVIKLRCAHADCVPKFMRLSSETFPDLEGPQLQLLSNVCLAAHNSEKFYLSVAPNQWVRTSMTCDKSPEEFFSEAEERPRLASYGMTIHSNVLPLDPFWTNAQAGRNDASKRAHFPCSVLQEAVKGGNTLMKQVDEWREKREECELIGQHGLKRSVDGITREDPCRLFWEIRADVKPLKELARGSDGIVWLVLWRGGLFVRKDRKRASDNDNNSDPRDAVDTELSIVEKLSHPHIVFSFGVSYGVNKSSLYMECMQNDLYHCIVDRVTRLTGENDPPFSHQDSKDILLQFAKAVAHMHEENVVHGDLKTLNILISEYSVSESLKHFLVKVADLGSAQVVNLSPESLAFKPGAATTKYAAPEVLKMRIDKNMVISCPKKLDVYSFAIVAFEVLTGEEPYFNVRSQTKMKKEIIEGTLRPALRAECQKENFLRDERLLSLIEKCWHGDPSKRPSFSKIVEVLNSVRDYILKPALRIGHHPRQGKSINDTPRTKFEELLPVINGQHKSRIPLQVIKVSPSQALRNPSSISRQYFKDDLEILKVDRPWAHSWRELQRAIASNVLQAQCTHHRSQGMQPTKESFAQVLTEELVRTDKRLNSGKFPYGGYREAASCFPKQCTTLA